MRWEAEEAGEGGGWNMFVLLFFLASGLFS